MQLNPHWDQERVYQETFVLFPLVHPIPSPFFSRKLNGAILQMITYQEFLVIAKIWESEEIHTGEWAKTNKGF
jgi:hypothetical protein